MLHILFVCTGNICRSPTAERLAAAYGAQLAIPEFKTSSAGTRAVVGHPIHAEATRVLERLGGDASDFAARQITSNLASAANLVLTMTRVHRETVLGIAPRLLHRTFTLAEASRLVSAYNVDAVSDLSALRAQLPTYEVLDIPDPIGRDSAVFETVGSQIAELLPPLLDFCRRCVNPSG